MMGTRLKLSDYALFKGVKERDLELLTGLLKSKNYADGSYLFWQGDPADRLFLIQRGAVEILHQVSEATQVKVAVRQEGDSIGEIALIDSKRRSASVRAIEPVSALWLSLDDLEHIFNTNKDLYIQLIRNIAIEISRRLSSMDGMHSDSVFGSR